MSLGLEDFIAYLENRLAAGKGSTNQAPSSLCPQIRGIRRKSGGHQMLSMVSP